MRRCLLILLPLLLLTPIRADALSVRDILELSRAGLGDDVLLALIEVDPSVFPIDAATVKSLKAAGVSERVIVAMIHSARTPAAPLDPVALPYDPPATPQPQVVVIHHQDAPEIREVQVPVGVPVYVPVVQNPGFLFENPGFRHGNFQRPPQQGPTVPTMIPQGPTVPTLVLHPELPASRQSRPTPPVFWGNGGQLRPDAWKQ